MAEPKCSANKKKRRKEMKRFVSLLLALVMMLSLAACAGERNVSGTATADPLTKEDVIQVVIGSQLF